MNPTQQQEPTADVTVGRNHYIGGSEAHHVIALKPYGCPLSLLLDKCGIGNDPGAPDIDPRLAERGHLLEPVADALFSKDTGGKTYFLEEFSTDLRNKHPWLVAHADYGLCKPADNVEWIKLCKHLEEGPNAPTVAPAEDGLVQIKTMGEWAFNKMLKEGVSPNHLMQVQHEYLALRKSWGVLWILAPESFRRKGFLIGADSGLLEQYLVLADALWPKIEKAQASLSPADSPDRWTEFGINRLPADSPQCRKCKRRKACQGTALTQILDMPDAGKVVRMDEERRWQEHAPEYMRLRDLAKDVAEAMKTERDILEDLMGDATCAEGAGVRINFKPQAGRETLDGKAMALALQELADTLEEGGTASYTDGKLAEVLRLIAAKKKTSKPTRPFKPFAC